MTTSNAAVESRVVPDLGARGDDQKDRRRAKTIVNEFLLGVSMPLENRGVGHRLLPGLWQAAMNVMLSCLEADDVMLLMKDRIRGIVGDGSNANSPIRSLSNRGMAIYLEEVNTAAQTIMQSLDDALEKLEEEDLGDRFPETVFDAALQVLLPAWGPYHVRRALTEQSALLIRGVLSTCNFMEPMRLQQTTSTKKNSQSDPQKTPPVPVAGIEHAHVASFEDGIPQRKKTKRRVMAFAASDVAANGVAAWVVAMVCHDEDGRAETREISGRMTDPSGRLAAIKAVHECLLAACESSSCASVLLETPSERCVRAAIHGGSPGSRLAGEETLWADIDRLHAVHRIEIKRAERAVDRDLAERCDRMLRRLMDEQ